MDRNFSKKLFYAVAPAAITTLALTFPAIAAESTVEKDGITYRKVSTDMFGGSSDGYVVSGYSGAGGDIVIPDALDDDDVVGDDEFLDALDHGTLVLGVDNDVFSGNDQITSIKLPGYLNNDTAHGIKTTSAAFENMPSLSRLTGAGKLDNTTFHTDGTALYYGTTLYSFPDGFTGDYTVAADTTDIVSQAFKNTKFDTLTLSGNFAYSKDKAARGYSARIFDNAEIDKVITGTASIDEHTFAHSLIGEFEGANTESGSLVKSGKLLYYGLNSNYDVSTATDIYGGAFATRRLYNQVEDKLSNTIKTKTVFTFINGGTESELQAQRYFVVNGNIAFCYDHSRDGQLVNQPSSVGTLKDYSTEIETDSAKYNKIKTLLYYGVPNDATGLFEKTFGFEYDPEAYGIDGDAAANAMGSLVWEILDNSYSASTNNIYGIGENGFTKANVNKYINALRNACNNYANVNLKDFTLGFYEAESSNVQRLVVLRRSIPISKQDLVTGEELPGATLELSHNGTVVTTQTSSNVPHYITGLEDGEYVLTEKSAPAGYEVAESVTFTITDGAVAAPVIMKDKPLDKVFVISKQDIVSKAELPGAKLQLTSEDGTLIEEQTSAETPHEVKNLADGKYKLSEITAPDGYLTAETITFEVTAGTVDNGKIIMYDAKKGDKVFVISKQDATKKTELPGAKLRLEKEDGTLVEEWISTETPHEVKNLADGKYKLSEITAPRNYKKAETINFEVADGTVTGGIIVMYDEKMHSSGGGGTSGGGGSSVIKEGYPTPTVPETTIETTPETVPETEPVPDVPRTPVKTGDNMMLYLTILLLAIVSGGYGFYKAKHQA